MSQSFPFPVLSPDCMDYAAGAKYSADLSYKRDTGVALFHKVTSPTLVAELVSQGRAKFACYVSLPQSMLRKLLVHKEGDSTEAKQVIAPCDFHSAETLERSFFRPIVIATDCFNEATSPHYGLDGDCWSEGGVKIPRYGIIAFDYWKRIKNSSSSLLKIMPSDNLSGGRMKVEVSTDKGFEFLAYVSKEMSSTMRSGSSDKNHVRSILTHALSRGFEILASEYDKEESWSKYHNLSFLADQFHAKGIPHWSEENFKPENAATIMHPHCLDNTGKGGDNHDE